VIARYKHSSFFGLIICNEEKKSYITLTLGVVIRGAKNGRDVRVCREIFDEFVQLVRVEAETRHRQSEGDRSVGGSFVENEFHLRNNSPTFLTFPVGQNRRKGLVSIL
jgi:hypothetical protein